MKSASLALFCLAPTALAHGFVSLLTIDGKGYKGPEPGTGGGNSAIRVITNTNPNHLGDAGADLACGKAAATKGAKLSAQAKPGSSITWKWDAGDGSPWPHDIGPLITYAADCGGDCSKFDATKGKWFKIDQVGKTKTPGNIWVQKQLMQPKDYSTKLPDDFPNGNFLLRHEIIALHLADKKNGAEFYPSCAQITVTGGSNSTTASPTVSFPGGYSQTDAGIFINVWDKTGAYPFPGPDMASFKTSSSSSGSSSATNATTGSSSVSNSTSSSSSDDGSDDPTRGSSGTNATSTDNGGDDCDDNGGDDGGDDGGDSGNDADDSGDDGDDNGDSGDDNGDDNGDDTGDSGDSGDTGDDNGGSDPDCTDDGDSKITARGDGRTPSSITARAIGSPHDRRTKTYRKLPAPTSPAKMRRSRAHHRRTGHRS